MVRICPNEDYWGYNEAEIKLYEKAKHVDLQRLGADSTHEMSEMEGIRFSREDKLTNLTRFERLKRLVVSQCLMDNVSNTEAGLSLRWLMPDADFLDEKEQHIMDRDWTWPANGRLYEAPIRDYTWYGIGTEMMEQIRKGFLTKKPDESFDKVDKEMKRHFDNFMQAYEKKYCFKHDIIEYNIESRNDRKVMMLFGVGIVQPTNATTLDICRGHVKTVEILSLAHMKPGIINLLETAILFKRNDDMNIRVTLPSWFRQGMIARDKIVLYGIVGESIGSWQTG